MDLLPLLWLAGKTSAESSAWLDSQWAGRVWTAAVRPDKGGTTSAGVSGLGWSQIFRSREWSLRRRSRRWCRQGTGKQRDFEVGDNFPWSSEANRQRGRLGELSIVGKTPTTQRCRWMREARSNRRYRLMTHDLSQSQMRAPRNRPLPKPAEVFLRDKAARTFWRVQTKTFELVADG